MAQRSTTLCAARFAPVLAPVPLRNVSSDARHGNGRASATEMNDNGQIVRLRVAEVAGSIDGAPVYEARYDLIRYYLRMDEDEAVAVALWSMVDWVLDAFDAVPYLGITSPEPEAGKSNLLALLAALV